MLAETIRSLRTSVFEGCLLCRTCDRCFPIVNGVLRMLDAEALDAESQHELQLRDAAAPAEPEPTAYWRFLSELEIPAQLAALQPIAGCTLLELGCGTGRYTVLFASRCRAVLAVDFSLRSLEALARRLPAAQNLGLVHANITCLAVAAGTFHRVFSTTSLDSREQRLVMHHLAAEAISDEGRYVFSTEHYDLRSRLAGLPRLARYTEGGMLFSRLTRDEVIREAALYFRAVRCRPIQVLLPFLSRNTGAAVRCVSRLAERLPVLRQLGNLLLVQAAVPLRPPCEGAPSECSQALRRAYLRLHRD